MGFRLGSMLSFYVAADDYIYGTRIDETTSQADKKTQNDVHLAVGFGVPLGIARMIGRHGAPRLDYSRRHLRIPSHRGGIA